jgi:uncharacterized membrane protein
MDYVFNALVLIPATTPLSIVIFILSALISSGFFRFAGSGIGLYVYAAVTALIVVPFILFVLYAFLMAAPLWTFSDAVSVVGPSILITPLGAGWLIGMAIGGIRRPARTVEEV